MDKTHNISPAGSLVIEQQFLTQIIEQNPAAIVITDPDGWITYVNPRFCEVTGYQFVEALGQNPRILQGEKRYTDYREMWRTLNTGKQWRGEFHNKKKNGEFFWELALISPLFDSNGRISHFLAIKEDITERKRIDEQLQRTVAQATQLAAHMEIQNAEIEMQRQELDTAYSTLKSAQSQMLQREKMASIGQLAAGVAHEINNPLGFIASNLKSLDKYTQKLVGYITFLEAGLKEASGEEKFKSERKKLKLDFVLEDIADLIEESLDGADRVKRIVQNLKTFSRVDQAEEQSVDLNECVESTIAIVWNEIKYKAELEKDLAELPELVCNPQELTQVFTNILVNAAQAIEKDGLIKICSQPEEDHVVIRISDNGCGIAEENLGKIFEPFFTTKEVGKGTGLGMSISFEIIKKHGGEIMVSSKVGAGTTFTIRLPRGKSSGEEEKER